MAFLVQERPHTPQPHARLWGAACRRCRAISRNISWASALPASATFSNTLLILWAAQAWTPRYGQSHAVHLAMLFYVGYNVVYTASCYASGLLADRFPKHWVLAVGYALAVVPAIALLTPGDSLVKFAIVFGVSGLYMGVWETLESSTSATLLPDELRGAGFGVLSTVNGIGDFLSSLLVGALGPFLRPLSMGLVIATSLTGAAIIARTGAKRRRRVSCRAGQLCRHNASLQAPRSMLA